MTVSFDDYEKLLNSRPENETYFEAIALSHSLFTKTYYLVVNTAPMTATIKDSSIVTFEPANIVPQSAVNSNDLDQLASFTIGDVNNELDDELDRIPLTDNEQIICDYYVYHSEHLDDPVELISFYVDTVPQKKGAFTIKAGVPDLNNSTTGEIFSNDRFPQQRSL